VIELPEFGQPRPVAQAAALLRDRETDRAAAREAVEQAKRAISTAMSEDRARYADALDRGEEDPGREAEQAARRDLDEAERRFATEEVRLTRARRALDEAIDETIETWEATLRSAVETAETEALSAVDVLVAAEQARASLRVAHFWASQRRTGAKLPNLAHTPVAPSTIVINVQAGPQVHDVLALAASIRTGIEKATLAAEHERQAESGARLHVA
jgi:hypothetical protein